jgi:hypothetical protein
MAIGALAIATLVVVPLIAHLLRRGGRKPIAFALARLVQPTAKFAARRSYFQDRFLFAVRALLVVSLAVLGAAPLVRCSHPTLERQQGASVALAIVLDDSASMRALLPNGKQRFAAAKAAALRLLSELREGDVVTLVLAGKPARLLVAATPQLQLAQQLCANTHESDRSTDLDGAIELADNSLRRLPQLDHRIALLSDLEQRFEKSHANVWLPLPELATPVNDCAVIAADQRGSQVEATIACTRTAATSGRTVSLVQSNSPAATMSASVPRQISSGKQVQTLVFDQVPPGSTLIAKLDGSDDGPSNDRAPVFDGVAGTVVATVSDYTTARAATGGPPLVEQAFAALGSQFIVRPWSTLPESERAYSDVSLLILDDPSTFGPEMRAPLISWLSRGGVAAAFLGSRAIGDQLGTSLAPFVDGAATWSPANDLGISPPSVKWLQASTDSWEDIHAKGRLELDQPLVGTEVRGRWHDDRVAILEKPIGRGQAWAIGVPVSANNSDFALRPAFLIFLNQLLEAARHRGLSPISVVGNAWKLDKQDSVRVHGPDDTWLTPSTPPALTAHESWYVPTLAGTYKFVRNGTVELRIARMEADEIAEPATSVFSSRQTLRTPAPSRVEISPYIAIGVTVLLLLELLVKSAPTWLPTLRSLPQRLKLR